MRTFVYIVVIIEQVSSPNRVTQTALLNVNFLDTDRL